jgi:hypothetical protein
MFLVIKNYFDLIKLFKKKRINIFCISSIIINWILQITNILNKFLYTFNIEEKKLPEFSLILLFVFFVLFILFYFLYSM